MDSLILFRKTDGVYSREKCSNALELAEELIKNYCNIDTVPQGLQHTLTEMAAELLRISGDAENGVCGGIASLSIGDARVSFDGNASAIPALTAKYAPVLNRYRRIRFV